MELLATTLEPLVHQLDQQVLTVRQSQQLLQQHLTRLLEVLESIRRQRPGPTGATAAEVVYARPAAGAPSLEQDIEDRSRRVLGLKRRLTLVESILQTVNSRVKKLLLAHDSRRMLAADRPVY